MMESQQTGEDNEICPMNTDDSEERQKGNSLGATRC